MIASDVRLARKKQRCCAAYIVTWSRAWGLDQSCEDVGFKRLGKSCVRSRETRVIVVSSLLFEASEGRGDDGAEFPGPYVAGFSRSACLRIDANVSDRMVDCKWLAA